jgi:hypothetical protein
MRSTGTTCRPIAAKYQTAAGVNPTLVIFDELWGFPDRKFYDELTESPARKNPLSLVVTYAGYDKDSLLYKLYEDGMKKRDSSMFFVWFHDTKASWIKPDYIERQRRRLPTNSFLRFHENRWAAESGTFVTEDDIAKLHSTPWVVQYSGDVDRRFDYVVANDLGLSHDRACRVVGHYDIRDGRVYIDNIKWWEGTKKEHVPIKDVEKDLWDIAAIFKTKKLVIDPWQMEYVIQRAKPFFNVVPFNFNADMTTMSQTLIQMLRNSRLVSYEEPQLDKEFREILSKQTGQGWRIEHVRGKRNDLVVTVGMMAMEAVRSVFGSADIPEASVANKDQKAAMPMAGIRSKEF